MALDSFSKPVIFAGAIVSILGVAVVSNSLQSDAASVRNTYERDGVTYTRDSEGNWDRGNSNISLDSGSDGDYGDPRSFDLSDFDTIRVDGAIALHVTQGAFSVSVEVEDDRFEEVELSVKSGQLIIGTGERDEENWNQNTDVRVTISMPTFKGIEVRGAIDGLIEDIESDRVEIELKGAGNLEFVGTCGKAVLDLRGAGNVEARKMKCKDVEVDLRGVGNAEVYASERVDADLKGLGNIEVYGEPGSVRENVSGFGDIDIH